MIGVLIVNLGTPDSPETPDVRKYLREFLMDGRDSLSLPLTVYANGISDSKCHDSRTYSGNPEVKIFEFLCCISSI